MNHKQKTKMARKMMTKNERTIVHFNKILVKDERTGKNVEKVVKYKARTSPFASAAWSARKLAIEKKVERKISKAKELVEKKRQEKLQNIKQ